SAVPSTDRERAPAPEGPPVFEAEKPVSRWLDEKATAAFRQRATWLEEEARSATDPTEQARALLTVSEVLALVGDRERALAIAIEARDLPAGVPLAGPQARQLM